MVTAEVDEFKLLTAVDALRGASPEQQEAAIRELEQDHPGIGNRVRALLAIEKQTAEAISKLEAKRESVEPPRVGTAKVEPLPKVRWKKIGAAWFKDAGNGWRRHLGPLPKGVATSSANVNVSGSGVAQLKVVGQAKPEPEPEPEPEKVEPQPKSEAEKVGKAVTVVPPAPALAAELDDAIAAMNRQHAIIENVGGKAVIASWEPSTYDTGKLMVVF